MSFWDGTRWAPTDPATESTSSRLARWAATAVMVIGLVALMMPLGSIAAASHRADPGCTVSPSSTGVNESYTVSAWGLPTRTAINLWVTENGVTIGSPLGRSPDGTFNLTKFSSVAGIASYAFSGPTKSHTSVYARCSVEAY